MQSDEDSFGWISLDEDERNLEESVNGISENITMVKLEKNSSSEDVGDEVMKSPKQALKSRTSKVEKISPKKGESPTKQIVTTTKKTVILSNKISSTAKSAKKNNILNEFLENNTNFTKMTRLSEVQITDEDDIYLLQCPKDIDIKCLVGLNILQKDKKKFKVGETSYECIASESKSKDNVTLLLPPSNERTVSNLSTFDVSRSYVIRQRFKTRNDFEAFDKEMSVVPFPSNLKVRHPLLGASYKPLLKIPSSVKEKFKCPPPKLHKKKIKEEIVEEEEEITVKTDKKGKRKRSAKHLDDEYLEPPKKIKKKIDMWTSETSIEKSLFEMPTKISKKKKEK